MQVFEFHFNPPKQNRLATGKDDLIFDSFCFEPKNIYEKRLGSLYITGLLKYVLPKNIRFLDVLAQKIKEKYYQNVSLTPEKSLRDSLRIANEYLEKIAKAGDVSWLGNLSLAAISLTPRQKNGGGELNFTKVGDLKLFLLRKGQLVDIDQKLKFEDIEPYPLKIFGNIVSGKLAENDIILVLSKEVYDAFLKENLLNEIARKSLSDLSPEKIKKFKDILNGKKEQLIKLSGICLLIVLSKETTLKETETLSEKKALKIFSLIKEDFVLFSTFASFGSSVKEVFNPLIKIIKKIKIPKIRLKLKNPIKIPKPRISIPKISFPTIALPKINKKIILVLVLIVLLVLGFFIFEKKEEKRIKAYQSQMEQIQEKINRAESYMILAEHNSQAKKDANTLYLEAWDEISPLLNISSSLPSVVVNQALELKNTISENLEQLNKLVKISEPELIFEFKAKEFIPQKLISFRDEIYFFTPYSENIFKINQQNQGELLEINKKFSLAAPLSNSELSREAKGEKRTETSLTSLIFFSEPNEIVNFQDGKFSQPISLENPSPDFSFTSFSSYRSHLYFLDAKNNSIVRYPFLRETSWGNPEPWLSPEIKTAGEEDKSSSSPSSRERDSVTDFKSMAVDGSIWILTKENEIERYHNGKLQETINSEIFPQAKTFSKIFTTLQLPYLYILEPEQKRIIILDKSGQIIKQYQSEKFDNLLDFSVSEDNKTIYLLNGLRIYKINF